jgi:hypothetical protein
MNSYDDISEHFERCDFDAELGTDRAIHRKKAGDIFCNRPESHSIKG